MEIREYLNQPIKVYVDRPLGSKHPKFAFIYPLNYGYIPNTLSGDGEEIDAYIIGEFEPLEEFFGYVVAIVHRRDDQEDKLVVCKEIGKYSKEQINALVEFVERYFDSEIVM